MPLPVRQPRIPDATYRVQLHKDFTFNQAREIVPYLHALGISDLYTSPFFQASPGSTHGYDIVDHNHLNPEIGTRGGVRRAGRRTARSTAWGWWPISCPTTWASPRPPTAGGWTCSKTAPVRWPPSASTSTGTRSSASWKTRCSCPSSATSTGACWKRANSSCPSRAAAFFLNYYANTPADQPAHVQPDPPAVALAELKADQPGRATPSAARRPGSDPPLRVAEHHDAVGKHAAAHRHGPRARSPSARGKRRSPRCGSNSSAPTIPHVAAAIAHAIETIQGKPGDARSFDPLDALIEAQAYRLSYWRVAAEEINYRRFFDINTLAAIRVEMPEVFDATHQLALEAAGKAARSRACASTTRTACTTRAGTSPRSRKTTRALRGQDVARRWAGHLPARRKNPLRRRGTARGLAHPRHDRLRFHHARHAAARRPRGRGVVLRDVPEIHRAPRPFPDARSTRRSG